MSQIDVMNSVPYISLAVATLVYLLVDLYPTIKSFKALAITGSFWLLLSILIILNLIAWGMLEVAIGSKAKELVGRTELAELLLIVLATLGTVTMLQSFTLKAGNIKVVDVGPIVESFRQAVLASVAQTLAITKKREEQKLANKLALHFSGKTSLLRTHFHTAFSFGGNTAPEIQGFLTQLEADAKALDLPFEQLLAVDIVKADADLAKSLV